MNLMRISQKIILFIFVFLLISIGVVFAVAYSIGAPPIYFDEETEFYDQNGQVIPYHATKEAPVDLDEISPYFLQAIILVEDKNFYQHHGFQFKRMIKALWNNLQAKTLKEGASSITQQLAKNLYLTNEKTWTRKIKEAFYTIRLEMFYTKEEILRSYLHTIYFGHGAYGIHEASQFFFNKKPADLSLSEATTLAAIPKGPTYYSPLNNKAKALDRKQLILQLLYDEKLIGQEALEKAEAEELKFYAKNEQAARHANYYIDTAIQEAAVILQTEKEAILNGAYKIHTSYDPDIQAATEKAISLYLQDDTNIQVASVTMEVSTGAITALVGGKSYEKSSFNRAIGAKRMVGSTFKPFLYYAALEQGFTPVTKLVSEPTVFHTDDKTEYKPRNYNDNYAHDAITLADALALSDNIYAVKTNLLIGPEKVIQTAKNFGIKETLTPVPSLALGISSISVLDMTNAYRIIANSGKTSNGYTIEKISQPNGAVLYQRPQNEQKSKTLDENKLFVLTSLMTGMFDSRLNNYMNVTGASIQHMLTRVYAGKSGTTDTDSWMIGFSPSTVTGVWLGYDENKKIESQGEKAAVKQIWAHIMEEAHQEKEKEDFQKPAQIEEVIIDPQTGKLARASCPVRRKTYFETGTAPTSFCNLHHQEEKEDTPETQEDKLLQKIIDFFTF